MAHGVNNALYIRRRARNTVARTLALAATAFGLGWLVLILGARSSPRTRRRPARRAAC